MEENVSAFNMIFGIGTNGFKYSNHNGMLQTDHFLSAIYFKSFVLNKTVLIEFDIY